MPGSQGRNKHQILREVGEGRICPITGVFSIIKDKTSIDFERAASDNRLSSDIWRSKLCNIDNEIAREREREREVY